MCLLQLQLLKGKMCEIYEAYKTKGYDRLINNLYSVQTCFF